MTRSPRPNPRPRPRPDRGSSEATPAPKPYELISFPKKAPPLSRPIGHDRYRHDRLHGCLSLKLIVQTSVHISTGVVALGSDIGQRGIPLIKTMTLSQDQSLVIQGSSLKGCIRSVYEAITNSTLGVSSSKPEYKNAYPDERKLCSIKEALCPASLVFGALNWQGLVEFEEARCESRSSSIGFMPSLYRPRPDQRRAYFQKGKVAGRKFYYHHVRDVDGGSDRGTPVQQASTDYTFTTQIHFKNLKSSELGTLFVVLGQDPDYPIALKLGGGKPIGKGSMLVEVTALEQFQDVKHRYLSYTPSRSAELNGDSLNQFMQKSIQTAHKELIQKEQLQELAAVLRFPANLEPPEGMY